MRSLTASRGVLTALGVEPEIGRWFSAADDTPGAPDTVMLGHGYWQRRFGGDPGVLERALTIDGRSHQIVGVMPADFRFGGEFEIAACRFGSRPRGADSVRSGCSAWPG